MGNIYDSLKKKLNPSPNAVNKHRRKRGAQNDAPILQTLKEPLLWDWPVDGIGITNQAMYNFCDKIPDNFRSTEFLASGNSFSTNYNSFLQLINSGQFPLSNDLTNSLAINNPQNVTFPNGPIPKYWTNVLNTHMGSNLQRGYNVSSYPQEWITKLAGRHTSPLDLHSTSGEVMATDGSHIAADNVQFGFKAEAWGTITVSPAGWYTGSIVSLAKGNKGPYVAGVNNPDIFSNRGLIPSRIASFIVALNPTSYVVLSNNDGQLDTASINTVKSISTAGFSFNNEDVGINGAAVSDLSSQISMSQNGNSVTIEAKPQNGNDIAFIIAVQLERL